MLNTLQARIKQHQFLNDLRLKLLRLHKLLLDTERHTYEEVRGQVSSSELLQLVIHHEQFAWLHQLSELIVQIDEIIHADEPIPASVVTTLLSDLHILLTPDAFGNDFAVKYDAAFQRHPDVVLAHADVGMLLAAGA
ncbi:MAG: hypothetical protein ACAF41_03320 [Leptolyngbya sp. BL-A-14]